MGGGCEAGAVVGERENKRAVGLYGGVPRHLPGLRVAAEIGDYFLRDAENLHLFGGRQAQTVFQIFVASKFVSKPEFRRRLRDGLRQSEFQCGGQPDVFQYGRA